MKIFSFFSQNSSMLFLLIFTLVSSALAYKIVITAYDNLFFLAGV